MTLFKGKNKVTSPFGAKRENEIHKGIDVVGLESDFVLCPVDGIVKSSYLITDKHNRTWEWGNYVKVVDSNGISYFFCHLAVRRVKVGDKVKKGDIIGIQGNTGYSFGKHLHFEVRNKNNVSINPILFIAPIKNEKGIYSQTTETPKMYTVQKGDTLSKISKMYNLSIDKIMQINPQIKNKDVIFAGQKIKVKE
jgi:murein DD-endopeptidase MepM/ murein hydrolase activator NlpD